MCVFFPERATIVTYDGRTIVVSPLAPKAMVRRAKAFLQAEHPAADLAHAAKGNNQGLRPDSQRYPGRCDRAGLQSGRARR